MEIVPVAYKSKMSTSRAQWAPGVEKGLVDVLIEYSDARWRGQNGWTAEGWNKVTKEFNEKFPNANYTNTQIKEYERDLKSSYKLIKELRNKSGIFWDSSRFMISTSDEVWKGLIQANLKAKKWQTKSFPLFDSLSILYEGSIAEGRRNFTSIRRDHNEQDDNTEKDDLYAAESQGNEMPMVAPQEASSQMPQKRNCSYDSCSKAKKRSKDGGNKMADAMESYVEMKRIDYERRQQQSMRREEEFSISKCTSILKDMEELTVQEVVKGSAFFLDACDREIFVNLPPEGRIYWIQDKLRH